MWRAGRLVIETGVHVLGMFRQRAVECLTENSAPSQRSMDYEVNRYIGRPAQALGNKIGDIRIRELRSRAEKVFGSKVDLRAFHATVLADGAMPLDSLEARLEAWIAARK